MNLLHQLISGFHQCYEAFAGATTTTLSTTPPFFAKSLEILQEEQLWTRTLVAERKGLYGTHDWRRTKCFQKEK